MPQLDPATFASQVFWLVVSFVVLTLILWRVALPRISSTLENRQQRIDSDITRAEEIATEAEGVLSAYEEELTKARFSAQEELHKAAEEAIAETETRNNALTEKLATNSDTAHQRIDGARKDAIANVSGMVEDIARQAVERLVETTPDSSAVASAVNAALGERT
ncbi:MAG: F0F1 ATP synthase subunit B' [Alphaproteobacteria bacterium]|jgi:F-type H+-transporting ATPase subunit b|nr:F0F1 ATP synthase subunit B' [Alphaproteobacteria bacterium]